MEAQYGWSDWVNYQELPDELKDDYGTVAIVYGRGGGNRYQIWHNGDVYISEIHAQHGQVELAKEKGFLSQ